MDVGRGTNLKKTNRSKEKGISPTEEKSDQGEGGAVGMPGQ
jgi:hypothetical protein